MSLIHKFKVADDYFVMDVNSGAVHMIDKLVYDMLDENNDEIAPLSEIKKSLNEKYNVSDIEEAYSEIKSLVDGGMLYSKDLYEGVASKLLKENMYVKALCLNIAHDCNMRCKYCFAHKGDYWGKKEVMPPEVAKKAIDFVIKHSGPRKNIEVDLFGGEPLLAFDTVKEVVSYARKIEGKYNKNIRFTITTNATMLNDEIIDYIDKNMVNVVLSIDGRKETNDKVRVFPNEKGTYHVILPKIKEMVARRDKNKQYYVRGTFTRNNIHFFDDIMHLASFGFKELSMEPVVLPPDNELSIREEDLPVIFKEYDKLYNEMLKRGKGKDSFKFYHFNININGGPCIYKRISGCGSGFEYVAVTPEGDIYPCHQFVGKEEFKLGTVYSDDFNYDISRKFKEANIYSKPICKKCWARFYCSGGCQANNYNFNGDIHAPYEIGCKMQKKRLECAIALRAKFTENSKG